MFSYISPDRKVKMLPDGIHSGVITKTGVYSNPSGPDKLIVDVDLNDGTVFSYFFTPGFQSFFDLLSLIGAPAQKEGTIEESKLVGKGITFETLITTAKNGSDYCNVQWVKAGPASVFATNPNATVEEQEAAFNPFAEDSKKN